MPAVFTLVFRFRGPAGAGSFVLPCPSCSLSYGSYGGISTLIMSCLVSVAVLLSVNSLLCMIKKYRLSSKPVFFCLMNKKRFTTQLPYRC